MKRIILFFSVNIFLICVLSFNVFAIDKTFLKSIKLPPGFKIDIYSDQVPNARQMALGTNGTVFVGTREGGKVYALVDENKNNKADHIYTIANDLWVPNGVAFKNGSLYVAEINRVLRYDDIENNLKNPPAPVVINNGFPTETDHGWKCIAFGPDGFLYVPVGAPCNVCERADSRFASIMRMAADGSNLSLFANGVRNTVGFDWHPDTKELWFTDNGRDYMGDNLPPDELNIAPKSGLHFGFPHCHGNNIKDPEFGIRTACSHFTAPALELGSHVAALGMKFYIAEKFPAKYHKQIFIAEHGSWNRTIPIGYRVMLVTLKGNLPVKYEVFAEGWLQPGRVLGRPVDILIMPDGALLVSDDFSGVIYRISYQE